MLQSENPSLLATFANTHNVEEFIATVKFELDVVNQWEPWDLGTDGLAVRSGLTYVFEELSAGTPMSARNIRSTLKKLSLHGYIICADCAQFHFETRPCHPSTK